MINTLARYLHDKLIAVFGWRLIVEWEGTTYVHYAWSRAEINEWADCYPVGECWIIIE